MYSFDLRATLDQIYWAAYHIKIELKYITEMENTKQDSKAGQWWENIHHPPILGWNPKKQLDFKVLPNAYKEIRDRKKFIYLSKEGLIRRTCTTFSFKAGDTNSFLRGQHHHMDPTRGQLPGPFS